jgi:hypothetical protein
MCVRKEHNKERRCLSGNVCNDMVCHPQGDLTIGDLSPKYVGWFKVIMYKLQFSRVKVALSIGDQRNDGESNFNSGDGTGQMAQPWMFMMMMTVLLCACVDVCK